MNTTAQPLASFDKLVKATDGQPTGRYQLTVGDLIVSTNDWQKKEAEKWLPFIVKACNEASHLNNSESNTATN